MKVASFQLEESHREDIEELLFQLSGKKRTLDLRSHPNTHCVGVFEEERLVGFAQLFVLPKTTFVMGHLEDVIVHEDYRNRGLGKQLLTEVISLAKKEGCSVLNLTTREERVAAVSLFKSFGFVDPGNQVLRLNLEKGQSKEVD